MKARTSSRKAFSSGVNSRFMRGLLRTRKNRHAPFAATYTREVPE
jgi:hypothetical protein